MESLIIYLFIFVIGLSIGSFLNVVIYRVPIGESIVYGSSHCQNCGNKIMPWDLIPVISYFLLSGKCRYCSEKISIQYPFVELLTGILYILIFYYNGLEYTTIAYSIFVSGLIVVAFIDLHTKIIPDKILLVVSVMGLPFIIYARTLNVFFTDNFVAGLVGGGIFLLIVFISRGGMGGGDVKLAAVMGLFLGWHGLLVALFMSFVGGGIVACYYLISRKKGRKDEIPFGPFLAAGAIIALFWAESIIIWYLSI